MKLELLKKHLEEAVQTISRVSNKNLSLPVLGCVVISATNTRTVLRATNLDVSVEIVLKSKILDEGVVAVPSQIFSQSISAIADEKITLEGGDGVLTIATSNGEVKLNTVDTEEFPTLPFVKEGIGTSVVLSSKELSRALKNVSFAAASSGMRPELSSVFVTVGDSVLTAAATDSFRLAEIKLPIKTKDTVSPTLIPARNIQDILKVIDSTETVEVRIDENQATFIADGNFITSRVIDGAFPEYSAIIPDLFVTTATVLTEDIKRVLKKVSVVTDQTGQVEFALKSKDKSFLVTGANTQVGAIFESLSGALEGEDITMNFNVRYILDALGMVSTDSVVLKFSGEGKPLIINEVPDKGFMYLVMPLNK